MTKHVKPNSRWLSNSREQFVVLHIIEDSQGHTWVHYRQDHAEGNREYSCYVESFLERFIEDVH
jgi:hypothetical protein